MKLLYVDESGDTSAISQGGSYSASEDTIGIQIADIYCYPVAHIYEYNKKANDYWRFAETCIPKLRTNGSGNFMGYGLKLYPNTKTDPF